MGNTWKRVLVSAPFGFAVALALFGCTGTESQRAISCLDASDCPPGCQCKGTSLEIGACVVDIDEGPECGGTCDQETACPEGSKCKSTGRSDGVLLFSCQPVEQPGSGGSGGGGDGGDGGTGGTGGEDPVIGLGEVPDCSAGAPHEFSDGTFGSGWIDKLTESSPPESTFATRQAKTGGNPGRYHSIDLSSGSSMVGTSTCVVSLYEDVTYDPGQMGPYTNIYMRLQASTPGSEFSSLQTRFSVVVMQGDDLYWSGPESIIIKFADSWVDNQIDETQLRLWPSYDSPQAPAPDGEELKFGFITCVNGTREDSAVDNFIVRVCDTQEP